MRKAFTFLELVFVLVIIGILAKFGTNILMTTYQAYTVSTNNNKMLNNVELTLKQISNRMQYRIKSSVIAGNGAGFTSITSVAGNETVLEWVGYDIDGWLGNAGSTLPLWSGFINVNDAAAIAAGTFLESPATNTASENTLIQALRANGSATTIANAAIFFTGANSDVLTDYGWGGAAQNFQATTAAHRITSNVTPTQLVDATLGGFAGTDVYENYKLSWTAYAISLEDGDADGADDDLVLYYDYQPWAGNTFNNGTRVLLLQNIDTFKFIGIGETIQLQICVNDQDSIGAGDGGYSVCEETVIF